MPLLLREQREKPVPGVTAIKQCQAVSGQMCKVQVRAIALADLGRHDQAVKGLTVSDIVEHGQTGHGKPAVAAKEACHGRFQRQVNGGTIDCEYA